MPFFLNVSHIIVAFITSIGSKDSRGIRIIPVNHIDKCFMFVLMAIFLNNSVGICTGAQVVKSIEMIEVEGGVLVFAYLFVKSFLKKF